MTLGTRGNRKMKRRLKNREKKGEEKRTGEKQVAELANGGKRKAKQGSSTRSRSEKRTPRERTRIKRATATGRGGGTLKRRTFPHEPPKMRPGIVGPEPPDAQKLIKTATKLPTGVFCLLLLHYSHHAPPPRLRSPPYSSSYFSFSPFSETRIKGRVHRGQASRGAELCAPL